MNLQVIGLLFDGAGIFILGVFSIFGIVKEITAQSGTYWNYNEPMAKLLSYTRIDTTVGSMLLLVGFGIQIASLSGITVSLGTGSVIVVGLTLFFLLYLVCLRVFLSKWILGLVVKKHEAKAKE